MLEPVQFVAQFHHVANNGYGRSGKFFFRGDIADGGQRAFDRLLPAGRAPADDGDRGVFGHPVMHQRIDNLLDAFGAHDNNLSSGHLGNPAIIEAALALVRVFMAGEHRDHGIVIAMSDRNPRVIRSRHDRTDTRNDFKCDARLLQFRRFFGATAEHIWVSPFQPNDAFAFARFRDQQFVELFLGQCVLLSALAAVYDLCFPRRQPQQIGIHERVVNDHIGARQQFRAAQGQQAGVARAGANQINYSLLFHSLT